MTTKQIPAFLGALVTHQGEFERQLSTHDAQWALNHPQDAVKLMCDAISRRTFKPPTWKSHKVLPTYGIEYRSALRVFRQHCDSLFVMLEDEDGTPRQNVSVAPIGRAGTFRDIFTSLGLHVTVFTRSQVTVFCRESGRLLARRGKFTLFRLKGDLVAAVSVNPGGQFSVDVHSIDSDRVWDPDNEVACFAE